MDKQEAIAKIKQAIVWCDLCDLPKTKASMIRLLETLSVAPEEHSAPDLKPPRPH